MTKIKLTPQTQKQLKKLGVGIVYLFGSQAEGTSHPMSDFDIGIVMKDSSKIKNQFKIHSKIYDIFNEIFPITFKNEPDISFLQIASPLLQFEAINSRYILFESSPELRANFEEKALSRYLDFKPFINEYFQATLEAF